MTLPTRQLGAGGPAITTIGFGAWGVGGGGWHGGYGPQDDSESVAALHRAVDAGVNWVDTAPIYGLGHSEEVVGRALAGMAERPLVFTKCGLRQDDAGEVIVDLDPALIRGEIDASLRRLRLDAVDLLQIHWPPEPEDDDGAIEAAWEALAAIRDAGKARMIGVSNFDVAQLGRIAPIAPVQSVQPPYSLLRREAEAELLPHCERGGIGVIAYSPLASGLLTGTMTRERAAGLPDDDWRRGDPAFQEPALSGNLAVAERVGRVAARLGRAPAEIAIAWVLRTRAVTGAIVGFRRPAHVDALLGAAGLALDDATIAELDGAARDDAGDAPDDSVPRGEGGR
jgi:aryl-alcohol dehydrogenase-like predicted oxidoreductase